MGNMTTRDELLNAHPLVPYLLRRGITMRRSGAEAITNVCPVAEHKPGHFCVSVNPDKQCWRCHDHEVGGSIIDWIMHETGKSLKTVMEELSGHVEPIRPSKQPINPQLIATYDYTDESGSLLYQVCRYAPKTFKQRQPDGKGGWIWGLTGVTRTLFNLPGVLINQEIVVLEGEKDCLTLKSLDYTATTNAGGSSGWLPAYGNFLRGKDVILIPDTDPAGAKHAAAILESLSGKANSIKLVKLPSPYKDVTDYVESFVDLEKARKELADLIALTPHKLAPAPIYSLLEMEASYRDLVRSLSAHSFDLGKFLPSLGSQTRPLVPGELVLLMADTGVGKSAILQAIARAANPLPTLFFELELPLSMMFERFVQMEVGCFASDVERDYMESTTPLAHRYKNLQHILVCPQSGLSTAQIEDYIARSELKFGQHPTLVLVDYIGLIRDHGRSRYEQVSSAAEELKVIAKRSQSIVIMASQVSRPAKDKASIEPSLHSAKESGSLENSAGLVLGCWRPAKDQLHIKILKNTKGPSGHTIETHFDGAKMQIKEIEDL